MKKSQKTEINLNIHGLNIKIESTKRIVSWLEHDYGRYISNKDMNTIKFNINVGMPEQGMLPEMVAKKYHDNYILYEKKNMRIVDYFGKAIIFYNTNNAEVNIFSKSEDFAYEVFADAFETLVGEKLDEKGINRIHCLALEKDQKATLLLLPPGAGKTTLALKFLGDKAIGVLAEDMVLYKKGKLVGLNFRWGTREKRDRKSRLMKNYMHQNKYLIDSRTLNLSDWAEPHNLIIGRRISSNKAIIRRTNKVSTLLPLFKSIVLGLELQQSLAYFLLRNYKDAFSKAVIGLFRIKTMLEILMKSRTYEFFIGSDQESNYKKLLDFVKQ